MCGSVVCIDLVIVHGKPAREPAASDIDATRDLDLYIRHSRNPTTTCTCQTLLAWIFPPRTMEAISPVLL
jgi:hypothetical protein